MTALPVTKLNFGGLTFDIQSGAFRLGNLQCFGRAEPDSAGSCADLKLAGVTRSGVYNVVRPGEQFYRVMQCDMEVGGYESILEVEQSPPHLSVCGSHKEGFHSNSATVPFTRLLHSATNLAGGPGLDIASGIFTAPLAGVFSVTWDLAADNDGGNHLFNVFLRHNGVTMDDTQHQSYFDGTSFYLVEQGGRTVSVQLRKADTLELWCENCSAGIFFTTMCISLQQAL